MMGLATLEAPIDGAHQTVLNTAFHLNATPFAMLSQEARSRFLVQRTSVHLETNVGRWKQMQEKYMKRISREKSTLTEFGAHLEPELVVDLLVQQFEGIMTGCIKRYRFSYN
jgi:hypothetical protein